MFERVDMSRLICGIFVMESGNVWMLSTVIFEFVIIARTMFEVYVP